MSEEERAEYRVLIAEHAFALAADVGDADSPFDQEVTDFEDYLSSKLQAEFRREVDEFKEFLRSKYGLSNQA